MILRSVENISSHTITIRSDQISKNLMILKFGLKAIVKRYIRRLHFWPLTEFQCHLFVYIDCANLKKFLV